MTVSAMGEYLSVVLVKFVLNMRRYRYFRTSTSSPTSDITIRFSDLDFLLETNLAIRRCFRCFIAVQCTPVSYTHLTLPTIYSV